jgi:hypothetical protein
MDDPLDVIQSSIMDSNTELAYHPGRKEDHKIPFSREPLASAGAKALAAGSRLNDRASLSVPGGQ